MGVDQIHGGLEVVVRDWEDGGAVLFGGRLSAERALPMIGAMVAHYGVDRALIDPKPDEKFAQSVCRAMPSVFATESRSSHNGASLAEAAFARARMAEAEKGVPPGAQTHVVGMAPHESGDGRLVLSAFVPEGQRPPTHAVIDLTVREPVEFWQAERPDGGMMLEHTVGPREIGLAVGGDPAQAMGMSQMWSLTPPDVVLPTRGWTFVLSLFANGALMWRQQLTEGQVMGLQNLVHEAVLGLRGVGKWISWAVVNHVLPDGPYTSQFEIYAAQENVYVVATDALDAQDAFAAHVASQAMATQEWIQENAVQLGIDFASANIPAPDPYVLPDPSLDTYDYRR